MERRTFLAGSGAALLAAPLVTEAQRSSNVPRLCFLALDPGTVQSPPTRFQAFFQSLRDLTCVNGRTIAIDYMSANGHVERFPALAAECVRLKADIIAVSNTPAAQAAKNATRTIPIVMLGLGDPVGTGLVDSLARPRGNVTGTSSMTSELAAKRLQLLKEAVPEVSRVLVLAHLADPIAPLQVKALKEAAASLGMKLHIRDVRAADDLSAAFETGARDRVDGLLTSESIYFVQRARVTELAARNRLPAIYAFLPYAVDNGGLMAYQVGGDLFKHAAIYVDRILKGASPSQLAVQQPTTFKLVINLKTAKALGLTIPPSLLARADEVIQ